MIDQLNSNLYSIAITSPSEEALLQLCSDSNGKVPLNSKYVPAERYGMGRYIRKYGHYPANWPLYIMTDHGPTLRDWTWYEESFQAPVQFFHSPKLVREWQKVSQAPCYVLFSPFVFYRRHHRIRQRTDALGTLVFPTHNSHHLKDKSDIESYIRQLLALPEEFHPLSACLYFLDIQEGKHKPFLKHNIPVYTAGNWHDPDFTIRFYDILKNFKYTTSNLPGSYMFYSVEMGIPFSLYGIKPRYENESDPSLAIGTYDEFWQWPRTQEAVNLFQGLHTIVTPEQREWVEVGLGMQHGISRFQMTKILYSTWYNFEMKPKIKRKLITMPFFGNLLRKTKTLLSK